MRTADGESGLLERPQPPLVGRDRELADLYALIDGIEERGGALVVRGEAGIGKSALLAAASNRAHRRGVAVMAMAGVESEERLAFAGLHQLLRPYLERLSHLPEPQRRALDAAFGVADGEAPDLFLIGLATLELIAETAADAPRLAVVDDAQWLDGPSSQVLAFVARRVELEPVILLFAVREGVQSDLDGAGLRVLSLSGLSEDASAALLDASGRGLSGELKARILAEAAGNPLALLELPVAAAALDPDAAAATSQPLPLTARLERAFASRLAVLDADTRALLLLAALHDGTASELGRAAEALRGFGVVRDEWLPAAHAGLGTVVDDEFRFRHPLVRAAVEQSAGAEQRRQAHTALAEALSDEPERAVWHLAAAAEGPDGVVAAALDAAAGAAAARGGSDVAVDALERAGELSPEPALQALRLIRAGELAFELGRSERSVRLLRVAQQIGLPPQARAKAAFYLEALAGAWSGAAAVNGFVRIADDLAETGDAGAALDALATVAVRAQWSNLDDDTRRAAIEVADRIAVAADDPLRLSVYALVDPVGKGGEVVGRIKRMSPVELTDPKELFAVGSAAAAVWSNELALPFLQAAAAGFRADGRLALLAQALVFEAWADVRRGAVRAAITSADEAARLADETGQLRFRAAANLAEAIAVADRGDDETAERLIGEAEAPLLTAGANPLLALVAYARGRKALAGERFTVAYEEFARIFDPGDVAHQPFARGWALADLAEAAVHGGGDLDAVRGWLGVWEPIAAATKATHLEVQLSYAAALLTDDAGAQERFAAIRSAARAWPYYAARAKLAYGAWLRRHRRAIESRAPLREAAQGFGALGLARLAEQAQRELRASGERARRRVPETWAELTPQELQIAQLAAAGLSNREIGEQLYLSHRTVGTHLYRLFPKLGVTSRAQLRDALEPAPES